MRLRPIKRLGQHFLVDPNTIRRIVAQLEAPSDARVVEIGPGQGALTAELGKKYQNLIAIEIDDRAVEHLRIRFTEIDVRHQDVLEVDYLALAGEDRTPLWVIGNLPYNITSQILFGLLDSDVIAQAVLTMQKEVAERLVARPRTKEYGILSVVTQLFCRPEVCFHISPNVFRPKPDVWSSTVRLRWSPAQSIPREVDPAALRWVIRTAFNQRRKTLRNSLRTLTDETKSEVPAVWATKRAEELEPAEYVELTRILVVSA